MSDKALRIEQIVALLSRLATGDLGARGSRSGADDDLDAVIEGVNMLAEDLQASRAELEDRVRLRTAQLEEVNRDILRLAELGNLLQACETAEEAHAMVTHGLSAMFAEVRGAAYFYRSSRNHLAVKSSWGDPPFEDVFDPSSCWALRRGHRHVVEAESPMLSCPHVAERTGDSVCIPMSAHGETLGLLHLMGRAPGSHGPGRLTEAARQLAVPVAEQVSLALANLELRETLRVQALRDPLTGLHNRRFVDEWIAREVSRSGRSGRALGLIMADLDHFKQVNDVHGHDAGDELLRATAETLRQSMREEDLPCRYGGEEFLVLLSGVDATALVQRADLLRQRVEEMRAHYRGASLPSVTLSAGVAIYPEHGRTPEALIGAADTALYEAKRGGRNRVVLAGGADSGG